MPITSEASLVLRTRSRRGKPLQIFSDTIYLKLGSEDTEGRYSLLEDVTPAGQGTPLHVHHREDEGFYILEGDYLFEAAGERFEAHTGDFVFVPKHTPHRFLNIGNGPGTMLLTLEPAGLEVFFEELAAVAGPPDPLEAYPPIREIWLGVARPPAECLDAMTKASEIAA